MIGLSEAVRLITQGPAEIIGISAGSLCVGSRADVCIVDPNLKWTLSSDTLRSRGKNTPLLGDKLRGRVTHTLHRGKLVFEL